MGSLIVCMESDDRELVQRAAAGDVAAFEALVDRYYAVCLRYAWRQLGSREDGEEAVQDALVRAYRALQRGTQPDRFRSWLLVIVVNRCRTYGARLRRWRTLLLRLRAAAAVGSNGTHPAATGELIDARVAAALKRLSPPLREAFLLRHVENMSYEEMAGATGVGTSALKMRVKRATDAMSGWLEEDV